jgi:glycosyltransferase involved in cell wall biosynthesis
VTLHGQLDQPALSDLMKRCAAFVLPSFYEGLPLVLVEAIASGCRAVCTDLPAVREEILPRLGEALDLVPLPRLEGIDEPVTEDLPRFVDDLEAALRGATTAPVRDAPGGLEEFTWRTVFQRVERVWKEVARP